MSNQSGVQAAIRASTGTAYDYNSDWSALFNASGISAGDWNGRMLAWINNSLGTSYASLPVAQQAYAVSQGFVNWSAMNTLTLFDPTTLNLHLWVDISDTSTVFTDTAGTTRVTADGDLVARVNNKGSAGGTFTQATSSQRPVYRVSGGRSYLQFDGVDDVLEGSMTWTALIGSTAHEVVIAGLHSAITSNAALDAPYANQALFGDGSGYCCWAIGRSSSGVGVGNRDSGAGVPYVSLFNTYTVGTPYVLASRDESGVLYSKLNSLTEQTVAFTGPLVVSGTVRMGANLGATYTNGRVYAAYARKTVLTTGERTSLVNFAATKNGATL